ncbi:unnamed protein product [Amoebophrya sp. A120]|nr:unnamed protein product [Amoebophrya sp. A120]|eukprot:GSA120T00020572001.1
MAQRHDDPRNQDYRKRKRRLLSLKLSSSFLVLLLIFPLRTVGICELGCSLPLQSPCDGTFVSLRTHGRGVRIRDDLQVPAAQGEAVQVFRNDRISAARRPGDHDKEKEALSGTGPAAASEDENTSELFYFEIVCRGYDSIAETAHESASGYVFFSLCNGSPFYYRRFCEPGLLSWLDVYSPLGFMFVMFSDLQNTWLFRPVRNVVAPKLENGPRPGHVGPDEALSMTQRTSRDLMTATSASIRRKNTNNVRLFRFVKHGDVATSDNAATQRYNGKYNGGLFYERLRHFVTVRGRWQRENKLVAQEDQDKGYFLLDADCLHVRSQIPLYGSRNDAEDAFDVALGVYARDQQVPWIRRPGEDEPPSGPTSRETLQGQLLLDSPPPRNVATGRSDSKSSAVGTSRRHDVDEDGCPLFTTNNLLRQMRALEFEEKAFGWSSSFSRGRSAWWSGANAKSSEQTKASGEADSIDKDRAPPHCLLRLNGGFLFVKANAKGKQYLQLVQELSAYFMRVGDCNPGAAVTLETHRSLLRMQKEFQEREEPASSTFPLMRKYFPEFFEDPAYGLLVNRAFRGPDQAAFAHLLLPPTQGRNSVTGVAAAKNATTNNAERRKLRVDLLQRLMEFLNAETNAWPLLDFFNTDRNVKTSPDTFLALQHNDHFFPDSVKTSNPEIARARLLPIDRVLHSDSLSDSGALAPYTYAVHLKGKRFFESSLKMDALIKCYAVFAHDFHERRKRIVDKPPSPTFSASSDEEGEESRFLIAPPTTFSGLMQAAVRFVTSTRSTRGKMQLTAPHGQEPGVASAAGPRGLQRSRREDMRFAEKLQRFRNATRINPKTFFPPESKRSNKLELWDDSRGTVVEVFAKNSAQNNSSAEAIGSSPKSPSRDKSSSWGTWQMRRASCARFAQMVASTERRVTWNWQSLALWLKYAMSAEMLAVGQWR